MALMIIKRETVAKSEAGGSKYIQTSGLYTFVLNRAEIAINHKETQEKFLKGEITLNQFLASQWEKKAVSINYHADKVRSFGNSFIKNDGELGFGGPILESLAVINGLGEDEELSDPESLPVKYKAGPQNRMCVPEIEDIEVQAWVQFSYSKNAFTGNKINEKVAIKRFYRVGDGATGSEILSGENIGERIAKDADYFNTVSYADGLTAEDIVAWKKAQQAESAPAAAAPSAPSTAAAASFPAVV